MPALIPANPITVTLPSGKVVKALPDILFKFLDLEGLFQFTYNREAQNLNVTKISDAPKIAEPPALAGPQYEEGANVRERIVFNDEPERP